MITIAERVAAGAAYLDKHDPGWWRADAGRAIDLDSLQLDSGGMCVLGQRCPMEVYRRRPKAWMSPYSAQAAALSGLDATVNGGELDDWAADRGFDAAPPADGSWGGEYDGLTAEWKRIITGRRAAS
jgi:hypothetical protein